MPHLNYRNQAAWAFEAGQMQSPINLTHGAAQTIDYHAPITVNYPDTLGYVRDTGCGLELGLRGTAWLNNRPFTAQQSHLHTPSEHTIDGKTYAGELHFVHEASNGRLAVIGLLFEVGAFNPVLEIILDNMTTETPITADMMALLPDELDYFHYLGSLTTPPLTENVEWYVLDTPATLSAEQLTRFNALYVGNNRTLQPLNTRTIEHYASVKVANTVKSTEVTQF